MEFKSFVRATFILPYLFLTSCMALIAPDFVKDEIKQSAQYKKDHPDTFAEIKTEKRDIYYTKIGTPKKPKIIFVHGSPGSWGAYVRYLNLPSLRDVSLLISADRIGYGGSSRGGVGKTLEEQAKSLLPLLELDDPTQPVILVGHSYGGPVVAKMAAYADPRIKSLLIIAGSVDPSLEKTKWYQIPANWMAFSWAVPKDLVICNREILALKDQLTILADEWSHIKADVTVVQGTKDDLVDPRNADYIEAKLKESHPRIIRMEGKDHFIPFYEVNFIEGLLLEMVKKLKSTSTAQITPPPSR